MDAIEPALSHGESVDTLVRAPERRPANDAVTIAGTLAHATILVTAPIGGRLVGVSRARSDFIQCTPLADLAFDATHRRRGGGRGLVRRTLGAAGSHTMLVLPGGSARCRYRFRRPRAGGRRSFS